MTIEKSSLPLIQVGGHFKISDVSGQVAIGSDITQIMYKDCIFVRPDGSSVQGKSWLYTESIRPPIDLAV